MSASNPEKNPPGSKGSEFVEVFKGDTIEAGLVHSLLEAEGFQAFLGNENLGFLEPWLLTPAGLDATKVLVPRDQAERARRILGNRERKE